MRNSFNSSYKGEDKMVIRISELQMKDVINISDGKGLGILEILKLI